MNFNSKILSNINGDLFDKFTQEVQDQYFQYLKEQERTVERFDKLSPGGQDLNFQHLQKSNRTVRRFKKLSNNGKHWNFQHLEESERTIQLLEESVPIQNTIDYNFQHLRKSDRVIGNFNKISDNLKSVNFEYLVEADRSIELFEKVFHKGAIDYKFQLLRELDRNTENFSKISIEARKRNFVHLSTTHQNLENLLRLTDEAIIEIVPQLNIEVLISIVKEAKINFATLKFSKDKNFTTDNKTEAVKSIKNNIVNNNIISPFLCKHPYFVDRIVNRVLKIKGYIRSKRNQIPATKSKDKQK